MRIYKEEIFGPVLSVVRVDTYEEALKLVNENEYGNGTAIFTRDGGAARRFQYDVVCGMVGVNAYGLNYLVQDLPFGGRGDSGFGRFSGPEGLRECASLKSVVRDLSSWASIPTPIPGPLQYPLAAAAPAFTRGLIGVQFEGSLLRRGLALLQLLRALIAPGKASK